MGKVKCPGCEREFNTDFVICEVCKIWVCPDCKEVNSRVLRYCKKCGYDSKKLEEVLSENPVSLSWLKKEDFVIYEIRIEEAILPDDIKRLELPMIPVGKGVILSGRAPIWLYGYLIHYFHPARFVATYDPRFGGAVVVASHIKDVSPGDLLTDDVLDRGRIF